MRALNQFNEEDRSTYMALMKATISEALGLNRCSDEIDLLQRKIDALNKKMIELINDSVQSGDDMESREAEFKEISDTIALLKSRIATVEDSANTSGSTNERLEQIQKIIAQREQKRFEYSTYCEITERSASSVSTPAAPEQPVIPNSTRYADKCNRPTVKTNDCGFIVCRNISEYDFAQSVYVFCASNYMCFR